jgi:predicted DNA-binding protein with PD1-like motif
MYFKKCGNVYAVRLSVGEDVLTALNELCQKEDIKFAHVEGLGAVSKATVGFYSKSDKKYFSKTFDEPMEIVSLLGNITRKDDKPYLHIHASFSGRDCNVVGGHLNEAIIGVTAEIFVTVIDGEMNRKVHPVTGINVFDI